MSATSQPYGLMPVYSPGFDYDTFYIGLPNGIASGYATAIGQFSPVIMGANGTLTIATTGADTWGVMMGVEYFVSGNILETKRTNWLASQTFTAGTCTAYYIQGSAPGVQFQIQANGTLAQTALGDEADFVGPGNVSSLGQSTAQIATTLVGAGNQSQLRIMNKALLVSNDWGDAFTDVLVVNARSQLVSNKVAF